MGLSSKADSGSVTSGELDVYQVALVYQWREFSQLIHEDLIKNKPGLTHILGQLNSHIEKETFFAGGKQSSGADQDLFQCCTLN